MSLPLLSDLMTVLVCANKFNPTNTNPTTYNPTVPGNPGTAGNVLGVYFPGGGSDSAAPVVGATPVSIDYTTGGISISVVPGGYISVINA